jgi:NAD(P)H-flavin reductase
MLSSLGNIEVTPLASLTFVSFTTGDIVYLTGEAKNLTGPEAQALMRRQNALTAIRVTGYTLIRDALPTRQRPDVPTKRSPYSPPIKFLVEEQPSDTTRYFDDAQVSLAKIELLCPDLATFTFEVKDPVKILPGQAVALDFTDFVGPQAYHHMADDNPTSVNDDRIRTWTVSSAHTNDATCTFDLTMREKPGGIITGALFSLARGVNSSMPDRLADMRPFKLSARLVGVAGEFVLPPSTSNKLLFVAGGIGITPFLSMLKAMSDLGEARDVTLVLSTRESGILVPLVLRALGSNSKLTVTLDVFSSNPIPELPEHPNVTLRKHQGRLSSGFFSEFEAVHEREIFLCGSPEFEKSVEGAFGAAESQRIKKEGFNY